MSMFPVILPDGRALVGPQSQIAQLFAIELARLPPVYVSPSQPFGKHGPTIEPQVGGFLAGRTAWRDRWYARWSGSLYSPSQFVQIDVVRLDVSPSGQTVFHTQVVPESLADWTDVVPFLEAIAEDPGDRQRRLVYTDYLEDQGLINSAASLRELIDNPPLWFANWWRDAAVIA